MAEIPDMVEIMSDSTKHDSTPGPGPAHAHAHAPHHGYDHASCCGHDHDPVSAEELTAQHMPSHEADWTRRFLLFLEMAVLLLWAVMMVWFYASGRINNYLISEGTFRIQVLVGGLILAVLGFFNWQMRGVPESCGHDHGDREDCGHDHGHPAHNLDHSHVHGPTCNHDHTHDAPACPASAPPRTAPHSHEGTAGGRGMALALLALSVTGAVALTPDEFSDQYKRNMLAAYSSQSGNTMTAQPEHRLTPEGSPAAAKGMTLAVVEKYQPRNKAGNFDLDVMQLYYSGSDPEYAKVMKGQGVETVGQVVKDTANPGPGRWRVFVLQMTCCAADARPYSLPVQFDGAGPALQEMGWYKLTGKIDYIEEKGVTTAVLIATASEATLRPREQRTLF